MLWNTRGEICACTTEWGAAHADEAGRGEGAGAGDGGDIAAQLGVGAAAADAELDALKEAAEAEIMAPGGLIGRYAPLVAAFCHNRRAALPAKRVHSPGGCDMS